MPAKTIPIKQITSWSFSRFNDYNKCPFLAKCKHVDKMKEPGSQAMERGTAIHKLAEDYVKGALKRLPSELALFKEEFARLKGQKIKTVEDQWTFRKDWTLTEWNDWNGAWLRMKMDVSYILPEYNVLVPIDHKTGKFREEKNEEYMMQLELYALGGFKRFPDIDIISPRLWYLDAGVIYPDPDENEIEYTREDEPRLEKLWMTRIKPMMTDKVFKPRPGDHCRYCHFSKSKDGPCKF